MKAWRVTCVGYESIVVATTRGDEEDHEEIDREDAAHVERERAKAMRQSVAS